MLFSAHTKHCAVIWQCSAKEGEGVKCKTAQLNGIGVHCPTTKSVQTWKMQFLYSLSVFPYCGYLLIAIRFLSFEKYCYNLLFKFSADIMQWLLTIPQVCLNNLITQSQGISMQFENASKKESNWEVQFDHYKKCHLENDNMYTSDVF